MILALANDLNSYFFILYSSFVVDLSRFPRSLWRAARALLRALREEHNFRWQFIGGVVVISVAAGLRVTYLELAVLLGAVGAVLVLELFNSSLERLVDIAQPRVHTYAATIKDLLAGAVLLAALLALAAAVLILGPYLVPSADFVVW